MLFASKWGMPQHGNLTEWNMMEHVWWNTRCSVNEKMPCLLIDVFQRHQGPLQIQQVIYPVNWLTALENPMENSMVIYKWCVFHIYVRLHEGNPCNQHKWWISPTGRGQWMNTMGVWCNITNQHLYINILDIYIYIRYIFILFIYISYIYIPIRHLFHHLQSLSRNHIFHEGSLAVH
jgi:hypothetical protein